MTHNTGDKQMEQTDLRTQSDSIGEIAKALCEVQKTELFASTDATNYFKKSYATLSSVWNVIRKPLTDNGLSISQTFDVSDGGVTVVTTLLHTSGEWKSSRLYSALDKPNIQGLGSAITYLRRYSLSAMVGVCPDDDDAESAMSRDEPETSGKGGASSGTKKPNAAKKSTALPGNVETDGLGKIKKPGELNADEHVMVDYTMPGEDSVAMRQLKEYRPTTIILNDKKTHFKVGKFTAEISEDGSQVWCDVPKFGKPDFDSDACVPCLIAGLVRAHGVPFVSGKYGIEFETAKNDGGGD